MSQDTAPEDVIRLWPDGPPSTLAGVGPEVEVRAPVGVAGDATILRNVSEPTLAVYRPDERQAERRRGNRLPRRRLAYPCLGA